MLQIRQSELDMVNTMLEVIEESPVVTVDKAHPDIKLALDLWNIASISVQSSGWWYNKEQYQLIPDTTSLEVFLPGGTIEIDAPGTSFVKRGRKLYDLENHTSEFANTSSDDLLITCIMGWELEDLPPVMYTYLLALTKAQMLTERAFDANKLQKLEQGINMAFVLLQKNHLRYSGPNRKSTSSAQQLLTNQPQR